MSTVHLHAARHLMSRWYLAIWPPAIALAALFLPDLPWRPGALFLFDVALFPLATWLALAGGPDEDRLWRAIGSPGQAALGRILAHAALLAPAALVLDARLEADLGFTPGAYAASVLFTYGAMRAGAAFGKVWSSVALVLALGGLVFDAWLQIHSGTYAGVLDLRRGFLTIGAGGVALGALWETWLGAWGVGIKRRGRASIIVLPSLALLLVPPLVDRAMGPVRLYSAGLPQLAPDGSRAMRIAVSDGHLFSAVSSAWLWEGGIEQRVGPFDVEEGGLGPAGAFYLVYRVKGAPVVEVHQGAARWRCALPEAELPAGLSWREDGQAAVLRTLADSASGAGERSRSIDATGCADLDADWAGYVGQNRVEIRDGALRWGDQVRPVPEDGEPLFAGERAFLHAVGSAGDQLYLLDSAGPKLLLSASELEVVASDGRVCAAEPGGAWICYLADGLVTASPRPPALTREGPTVTDVDGAVWQIPESLDIGQEAPLARLDADTLRVATWDAIWDLRRDGAATRHPLTGAPEP